ncbi:MAG: hypothetical protein QNJ72_07770 [Pleurocapsa sp. MO_226.B13]|nr:hypothetical protein [Pleurocapsa sp. MO_226.B13]
MSNAKSPNQSKYNCCFCRHFSLEGHRWGYCELLNVYVKGNVEACQMSVLPFSSARTQDCDSSQNIA